MFSYSTATLTDLASRLIRSMSSESVLHHLVRAQGTNCVPFGKLSATTGETLRATSFPHMEQYESMVCHAKRTNHEPHVGFPMKHPNIFPSNAFMAFARSFTTLYDSA